MTKNLTVCVLFVMSNVNLCVYAVQYLAFGSTTDYHQKGIFIFKKIIFYLIISTNN
jgi:hypothetical protein